MFTKDSDGWQARATARTSVPGAAGGTPERLFLLQVFGATSTTRLVAFPVAKPRIPVTDAQGVL